LIEALADALCLYQGPAGIAISGGRPQRPTAIPIAFDPAVEPRSSPRAALYPFKRGLERDARSPARAACGVSSHWSRGDRAWIVSDLRENNCLSSISRSTMKHRAPTVLLDAGFCYSNLATVPGFSEIFTNFSNKYVINFNKICR
jgi:hypothetical protein